MVSLAVPSFKYGPPPSHAMHYPGIPEGRFTAIGATSCYRSAILSENNARCNGEAQAARLPGERPPPSLVDRIGDTLPGLASINEVYSDIGWTSDPSGRKVPPKLEAVCHQSACSLEDGPRKQTPLHRSMSSFRDWPARQTPLHRSFSSFKDAQVVQTPLCRSVSSFKDVSAGEAPLQPSASSVDLTTRRVGSPRSQTSCHDNFLSLENGSTRQTTPLLRSLSNFENGPTKSTPLQRSFSSFKDGPARHTPLQRSSSSFKEASGLQTPLRRSISSFKHATTGQTPLQRSSSSFRSAVHGQPFQECACRQGIPLSETSERLLPMSPDKSLSRSASWAAGDVRDPPPSSLPRQLGADEQRTDLDSAPKASAYLQLAPREIKREIQAQVRGRFAREHHEAMRLRRKRR